MLLRLLIIVVKHGFQSLRVRLAANGCFFGNAKSYRVSSIETNIFSCRKHFSPLKFISWSRNLVVTQKKIQEKMHGKLGGG